LPNERLFYKDESYAIQGAIFEVYREMGCGFLEAVYQECLEEEFKLQNIPFVAQRDLLIQYKGKLLRQIYKPDFICFDQIIVEIKALSVLTGEHETQVLNYLKATGYRLGLLVNLIVLSTKGTKTCASTTIKIPMQP